MLTICHFSFSVLFWSWIQNCNSVLCPLQMSQQPILTLSKNNQCCLCFQPLKVRLKSILIPALYPSSKGTSSICLTKIHVLNVSFYYFSMKNVCLIHAIIQVLKLPMALVTERKTLSLSIKESICHIYNNIFVYLLRFQSMV